MKKINDKKIIESMSFNDFMDMHERDMYESKRLRSENIALRRVVNTIKKYDVNKGWLSRKTMDALLLLDRSEDCK